MEVQNTYLSKRPYRKDFAKNEVGQKLIGLMSNRFDKPFRSYWEQFGFEIGGPVCCAYLEWIIEELKTKHSNITDIAFIARDGWLLKKIFDKLPNSKEIRSHYVYAPRTLAVLCREKGMRDEYAEYLKSLGLASGKIAVVDTVTMKFSSQRLISDAINNEVIGFFWVVLGSNNKLGQGLAFETFQQQRYHTIAVWNVMEFIMTSPEASIKSLTAGKPIYRKASADEEHRQIIFHDIEQGVLDFSERYFSSEQTKNIGNDFITKWVNDFLRNPNGKDKEAFLNVNISEREDHADSIPLDPFMQCSNKSLIKRMKDCLWLYSQSHSGLYSFLHFGNCTYKKIKRTIQATACKKYDGNNPIDFAKQLSTYDVISFDIFDTLIKRKVAKPTDLFFVIENESGLVDFHKNRIEMEAEARRLAGESGETDIYRIYDLLARKYNTDKDYLIQQEVEAEMRTCLANPEFTKVYEELKKRGAHMIATSDMYLPSEVLRNLLDNCGYHAIEQVFVSCEYGCGKANGELQKVAASKLGESLRYVHIGDNFFSDVKGSAIAGWTAIWYKCKTV